ncbi:GNAT family N-acetyltransferase [Streptomyces sp. NPDC059718]
MTRVTPCLSEIADEGDAFGAASTEALARATANFRQYVTGWGRTQRADGDLDRYRSGLATPQFNGVVRVRSLDAVAQAVTTARTELAGVPWWWWAGPDSPEGTPAALTRHGAVPLGALPLMVRPLDRAPDLTDLPAPQDPPVDLVVEAVETPDRPAEPVRTYRTSMGVAPELQPGLVRSEARRADNADIVRLAAVPDGDVVGTTVLITAHDVTTVSEYRLFTLPA